MSEYAEYLQEVADAYLLNEWLAGRLELHYDEQLNASFEIL